MKLTLFTCMQYIPEENWKNKQVNKVIRTTNVVQVFLNYDISKSQKFIKKIEQNELKRWRKRFNPETGEYKT